MQAIIIISDVDEDVLRSIKRYMKEKLGRETKFTVLVGDVLR